MQTDLHTKLKINAYRYMYLRASRMKNSTIITHDHNYVKQGNVV